MYYLTYYKKRAFSFSLAVIFVLLLFAGTANAELQSEPSPTPYGREGLSVARCISGGGFEFGLFLRSIAYVDGFSQVLLEPWRDVLSRNQCHSQDILRLIQQGDKMRKRIRDAYITCAKHKLPSLKVAYNRLVAELYYVRHVVDGKIIVSLPFDLSTRFFTGAGKTDRNTLYERMQRKYVSSYFFTQEEFDIVFARLEGKYEERKESYINCETDDWNAVKEKWDEFKAFFTDDAMESFEQGFHDLKARAREVGREATTMRSVEFIKGIVSGDPGAASIDLLQSMAQVNIAGFEAKEGSGMMGDFLNKSLPTFDSPPTHSDIMASIDSAEKVYEINKMEHDLKMEFAGSYFMISDQSSEIFLNILDGRESPETGLIEILEESLEVLDQLNVKARDIHKKQCKNSD